VKSLIKDGADVNQLGHFAVEGSALHVAVRTNQPEVARLLLDSGATVDIRDQHDYTPLHNAAWNGNLEMVKLLLASGANITARNYSGDTPLSCAYDNNKFEVIEFIKTKLQSASN
jgi:ankyrin repeat protein